VLFIDEIHRFNKAQQDAFLPHVESGTIILIGATTENPSFAINAALLSRARVFELQPLEETHILTLLRRALDDDSWGLGELGLEADEDALATIARRADGDARRALDVLEAAARFAAGEGRTRIDAGGIEQALAGTTLIHDKSGEGHYNVVSAFIKSMRGSDPDGALYWMMRMLEAGEDPLFVTRRMIIFASEDIGNADPRALQLAVATDQAFQRIGMPEALHNLAQCCLYLSSAPKSNAAYRAWKAARADVKEHGSLEVPRKLRNAATQHMKAWGYGEGYRYPHDEGGYAAGETYLPDALEGRRYYEPEGSGFEARIRERLEGLRKKGH
jgi:putative ATPase